MKITWVTDIHLNFLRTSDITDLCASIVAGEPDIVLIAGDIAEAPTLARYLTLLEQQLPYPVYFVLGNHDYYHGSVASTRSEVKLLMAQSERLQYLALSGVVSLSANTALIGHDSWGDGRYGDYANSTVLLNDYRLISELRGLDADTRLTKLNALGDESAAHFKRYLPEALATHEEVVLLTHVPPFQEAAWHEGKTSDDNFAPHFSCKAVGDVLVEIMSQPQYHDKTLTVLCGHTHGAGVCQKLPNLKVITGEAVYRHPQVQSPIYMD
ncbi:MAG: Icc protein [Phenylobacterium sp.]|jgi:Icc protein